VDFAVTVETLDDCAVVRVSGDLDMSGAAAFEEAALAGSRAHVVVDLGACTFLDSSGLRAIASVARSAERVSIVATDPGILRVLEITALDDMVPIHPSVESAR